MPGFFYWKPMKVAGAIQMTAVWWGACAGVRFTRWLAVLLSSLIELIDLWCWLI